MSLSVSLSLSFLFFSLYISLTEFKKSQVKEGSQAHIYPQLRIKGVGFDRTLGGLEMDMRLRDHLAKIFMVRVLQYYERFLTMTVPVYLFLCNFFIYFSINSLTDYSFFVMEVQNNKRITKILHIELICISFVSSIIICCFSLSCLSLSPNTKLKAR